MKRKVEEPDYDETQRRLERLTLRDPADGAVESSAVKVQQGTETVHDRDTKPREIKTPFHRITRAKDAQPSTSMKRSENVPFDTDESTDGDESEDDDDHTSGYNSGSDDIDLSVLANLTIRDFDICEFLQFDPSKVIPETDSLFGDALVNVSGPRAWNRLRKSWVGGVNPKKIWRYTSTTAIWTPYEDLSRCVLLHPALLCNPVTRQPTPLRDRKLRKMPNMGRTEELCFSTNGAFYYCGTYRCVGVSILRLDELCRMDDTRADALLDALVHRTNTAPSVRTKINMTSASIARTIRELYLDGTLRIYCAGVQLVGYNMKVKKSFTRCPSSEVAKREKKMKKKKAGKGRQHNDPPVSHRETKRQRRS